MYNKVILSAERSTYDAYANEVRTLELRHLIVEHGMLPLSAEGRWQGTKEASFVVEGVSEDQLTTLRGLASMYDQDAILVVQGLDIAVLIDRHGERTILGLWREATKEEAEDPNQATTVLYGVAYVAK